MNNKPNPEEDDHGYDNLCKYSIEKCELCDMVFSSRFANIIHSSQHIIIPLIKHQIHKCKKCLYCFVSKSELKAHKQVKHKKKDIAEDDDGQSDLEESQIGCEASQNGQEVRQIGPDRTEISQHELINHKKSATSKKKCQNSHEKSQNSYNGSQSESMESQKTHNESKNKADALLRSIVTNQPIVKIDNIVNIIAKTLLATKADEKHSKIEKDTNIIKKDSPKIPKDKKNKEKNDAKAQIETKNVNKEKNPAEIIFSRPHTSQNNITAISNKIIIGGKKPIKRTSPDEIDHKSKRDKKSPSPDTNKNERDRNNTAKATNGVHTTDLTVEHINRFSFNYREISPDVISIKSDSSDDLMVSESILSTVQSKRKLFTWSYEEDESVEKDQSRTVLQIDQSKTIPPKDQSKYIPLKDPSRTVLQIDQSKTVPPKHQSKSTPPIDQSKTVPPKDQSKTVPQQDQSKTLQQRKQSIDIPFVITDSDSELDANINELLNNITSPVKKSSIRNKIQFEDDENLQLLDLERELTNLCYEFQSVHYDKLMEEELCECRRCHMIFMNRLGLYKHETTHMRFRRTKKYYFCKYCENYYAGNHFTQRKHYEQVHNSTVDKKKPLLCPVCKLQYHRLKVHYKKHHQHLLCNNCSTCFGTEQVFQRHNCSESIRKVNSFIGSKDIQRNSNLLLVCELCLSFKKTTGHFKYEVVGEKCVVGERQKCFYCTKEFFEVKMVKRANMASMKGQTLKYGEGKKRVQGSNAQKLDMIRKRLKAMKK